MSTHTGGRRLRLILVVAAGLAWLSALALAPATGAQELVRIAVPSKHIDSETLVLNDRQPGEAPGQLMANVLLPDGYTPTQRYPLLLLLHGGSGSSHSWVDPRLGDIRETAKGLNAVIVMPDGGQSFYADWWNGGLRDNPGWETWMREELLLEIERKFSIRPERRFHAVAGLSMGGYGTWLMAGMLPGYFGTAVPLSSFASTRGALAVVAFRQAAGVPYETVYGPPEGFYAEGHDPVALASNYSLTRLDVRTGDGRPDPTVRPGDIGDNFSLVLEGQLKLQNDEAVAAIEAAGSKTIDYAVHKGSHSWEYWRHDLKASIEKGLFRPVVERPSQWTYKTASARGKAWDIEFQRSPAPTDLSVFNRNGQVLTVSGSGRISLSDERGCRFGGELPLTWTIPARTCRTLKVSVKGKLRRGRASRVTVAVKARRDSDRKFVPVAAARARLAGRAVRTNARGKAKFKVRSRRSGKLRLVVRKAGFRPATKRIRVRR